MGHVSFSISSLWSILLQQLKQSGISSFGIMNLDPKQRCMMMKTKRTALTIMKIPKDLKSVGSRVICGEANLYKKQGIRMTSSVNTKGTDRPPRPPIEQEQLICSAIKQKDSKIQKVSDSSKKQHMVKQPSRPIIDAILQYLPLKDLSTSSQFLKKKRDRHMLINAQNPTNFNFVSIFQRDTLMNSQLQTISKAKACRIIHYDILYMDLFGLKKKRKTAKRKVQTPYTSANLSY